MKTLGQRLKELRIDKKLTQKELAIILKTNNSSICDWECGRTEPNIDYIIAICKFFDITSDFLLGLED